MNCVPMNQTSTAKKAATTAAYKTFIDQYKSDPVAFAQDCLQLDPLEWQASVMVAVSNGERRLSVRSGHGVGKSTCAAAAGGGAAASTWNFILGGDLNIVLGVIVAFLSIVVLMQRFLINRREINRQQRERRE